MGEFIDGFFPLTLPSPLGRGDAQRLVAIFTFGHEL
jgi:hypothetical protein